MANGRVVIFLDIDGVLVPVSPMCFGGGDFDTTCIQRLRTIVAECGGPDAVTIVISSTWRHDEGKKARLNEAFRAVGEMPVTSLGVPDGVPHPPTVVTYLKKDLQEQKLVRDRVDEIYEWIRLNEAAFPEAAQGGRWFAIDDMNLGVDTRMKGHFLKTDTEEGITPSDLAAAKALIAALPAFAAAPPAASEAEPTTSSSSALEKDLHDHQPSAESVTTAEGEAAKNNDVVEGGEAANSSSCQEYTGYVKRYNPNRGFGFLTSSTGEDIFVHQSMIHHHGFRAVNVGEPVRFRVTFDAANNRRQAVDVVQLSPYIPTNIQKMAIQQYKQFFGGSLHSSSSPSLAPDMISDVAAVSLGARHLAQRESKREHQHQQQQQQPLHNVPGEEDEAAAASAEAAGAQVNTQFSPNSNITTTTTSFSKRSEYHGPGVPGRGLRYQQMPLIPDGLGFRCANGTVFYAPPPPTTTSGGGGDVPLPLPLAPQGIAVPSTGGVAFSPPPQYPQQ